MIPLPFASQEGRSPVVQNSQETLINMFAEVQPDNRLIRRQRAGIQLGIALGGEKRGIERLGAFHYAVVGNSLHKISLATRTILGTLMTSEGRCTIIANDTGHVMVSDGTTGYVWNGSSFAIAATPTAVGTLSYLNGYGIYNEPGTARFYVSAAGDFTSWNALDFATAELNPDPLVRTYVDHNELWLIGTRSTEVWQPVSSGDFPFARSTAQMEKGCCSAFSVASEDNSVFWLGDDFMVYRADGYRPARISTHPIEHAIAQVSDSVKAEASAFFYTVEGNKFYTLTFPGELTLQYNVATGFWNRARTYGFRDWKITGSAGKVTDFYMTPASLVTLAHGLNTDENGIMERAGISAPVYADGKRITLNSYWLDCEVGEADNGRPRTIMMRFAPDGVQFGNERWRDLGNTGEYRTRAIWRNCGQGRRFVAEFSMTDNTELKIVGAGGEMQAASS